MEKALLERAGFEVATTGKERPVVKKQNPCFLKLLLMTKMVIIFIAIACIQARASGQNISLSLKDAPLDKVFAQIETQSPYRFIYTKEELEISRPVSIDVKGASIESVLEACFSKQPVTYKMDGFYVIVRRKVEVMVKETRNKAQGRVVNEDGDVVVGATVTIKGTRVGTATNEYGEFAIDFEGEQKMLIISNVGYETKEVWFRENEALSIVMKRVVNSLDETVVIAYGKTSKRENTGNVSKLDSKDIQVQPISNPLAALDGRITGLQVTQSNGVPGAAFKVLIRGQNSIVQGSEPLFIIDGVPFAPNNQPVSQLSSLLTSYMNTGLSPFNAINISEIESIEVLKDADATAIYGSRGANGVVLISTKKGKEGRLKCNLNSSIGYSWVTKKAAMLNTKDYLQMRYEAFNNDGMAPTLTNAYDLLAWDTTRYTDLPQILTGGTARTSNLQASVSGGTSTTKFLLSGGYYKETTVFPGDMNDTKVLFNVNLNHQSIDKRLSLNFSAGYVSDKNNLAAAGLSTLINLPPNIPALYDDEGKLNWEENGYGFVNPLAYLETVYSASTNNFLASLKADYVLLKGLTIGGSVGYNYMDVAEQLLNPISAQDPNTTPKGSSQFASNNFKSWIAEPQLNYVFSFSKLKVGLLVGGTFQQNLNTSFNTGGSGYSNDALLQSIAAAPVIDYRTNSINDYRYQAIFGRVNFNYDGKYIINLSGRRDGSSRFGPGNQFANFLSAGGAWIFSKEEWIMNHFSFLSFGKIRGSYGTTGNDQIGNYKYLDVWSIAQPYQGSMALYPQSLYNPSYGWELNKKLEAGVELGFFKDRILLNGSWYRNRSSNQLVEYVLPAQTGFFSITSNFPALVQNSGWEFELSTVNARSNGFEWTSHFNISIPRNELVSFPGLASSTYSNKYVEGEPLSVIYNLGVTGVNPATGVFEFDDYNKDGIVKLFSDYKVNGHLSPVLFGGFGNNIKYKGWRLHAFFVFRKQEGANYANTIYQNGIIPGSMNNQPMYVLDRWQQAGDITGIQKFTAANSGDAYEAAIMFRSSDGNYGDASFIRLKTVSLEWSLPTRSLHKYQMQQAMIYCRGQNLLTFTNYKGSDPETQNLYALPPLRTIQFGIQLTF